MNTNLKIDENLIKEVLELAGIQLGLKTRIAVSLRVSVFICG
ncbi:hypothetical protein [uncultured Nostoc sp.]